MKKMITVALLSLMASSSFAAQVKSAKLDASRKNILVEVVYGGGCGEHNFSLKMNGCLESMPVQCTAQIVDDNTTDACEALVHTTAVISLKENKLTSDYFQGASLTILGDRDWETKQASKATVRLP